MPPPRAQTRLWASRGESSPAPSHESNISDGELRQLATGIPDDRLREPEEEEEYDDLDLDLDPDPGKSNQSID